MRDLRLAAQSRVLRHDVPLFLLAFPRLVDEADYLLDALWPWLSRFTDRGAALDAHRRTAVPDKVRLRGEGTEAPGGDDPVDHRAELGRLRLERAALEQAIEQLRRQQVDPDRALRFEVGAMMRLGHISDVVDHLSHELSALTERLDRIPRRTEAPSGLSHPSVTLRLPTRATWLPTTGGTTTSDRRPMADRPAPTHPPGARFVDAVQLVCALHRDHTRKGTTVPYVSHLLGVASLLLEHGAEEDVAIAGLLHDSIEDAEHLVDHQGDPVTGDQVAALIEVQLGERVLKIVQGNTDTLDAAQRGPGDWRLRKEHYLAHLRGVDRDTLLVSLADKVHNARALATDLQREGARLWDRFNAGSADAEWYYRGLLQRFEAHLGPHPLVGELRHAIVRIWGDEGAGRA